MDLHALLQAPATTLAEIAAGLDALPHAARLAQVRSLARRDMKKLFDVAATGPACTLEDFVPASVPARGPVINHGLNSLPVPQAFRLFEKRFCRPESGPPRLFGFNEGGTRKLIGPGYFVAHSTDGNPEWQKRGAIVVDYLMIPDAPVAEGWPKVVPNSQGLQMFVFKGMRDYMRKVSKHVTIGAAYQGEKAIGQFFALCREDV